MSNEPGSSDDVAMPAAADVVALPTVLRREALLPAERRGGTGHVTVACTLAGLASGLALATTLMAMQVAENINHQRATHVEQLVPDGQGALGVRYSNSERGALIQQVLRNTPADVMGLRPGDIIESANGISLANRGLDQLRRIVRSQAPGSELQLVMLRDGVRFVSHPLLAEWAGDGSQQIIYGR